MRYKKDVGPPPATSFFFKYFYISTSMHTQNSVCFPHIFANNFPVCFYQSAYLHEIIKYAQLEGAHKVHKTQLLALYRTPQE